MKQELLNKDVITKDMIYVGTDDMNLRITRKGLSAFSNSKPTFTDEYIESITSDERFINALLSNGNFIQNIKSIAGGIK